MKELYRDENVLVTENVIKVGDKVYQIKSLAGVEIIKLPSARNLLGIIPLYYGIMLWLTALALVAVGLVIFKLGWVVIPAFALFGAGWPLVKIGSDDSMVYLLRGDVAGTKRILLKDDNQARLTAVKQALENVFTGDLEPVVLRDLPEPNLEDNPATTFVTGRDTSNDVQLPPWLGWSLGGAVLGFLAWAVWMATNL